ncbi:protein cornichon homolog 4-like [Planococcus citri]|uniref:protein cornichon homolog 4-like n=1 Tax=Planococcus citri TaxID=170843 RepID=UPI0031FA21A4
METLTYILCLVVTGALLFLSIYFIITLSDLECDYLNATECCDKLNVWIIPRIVGTCVLLMLYVFAGNWYLVGGNMLFISFLIHQKFTVPRGNLGVYDPTEIHNRGQVRKNIQQCLMVIGWFLMNFFLDMYLGILSILKGDNFSDLATLEAEGIPYNSSV